MEFDFIDIDAFVLESAINVFEAHMNYANKMNLIRDINNNVMIPESLYNKLNDMISDKVVMEASVDTGKTVSTPSKFFTYQCDFKTHNPSIAKSNYRLAEYMISAFEASQQAKKQNTTTSTKDGQSEKSDTKNKSVNDDTYDTNEKSWLDNIVQNERIDNPDEVVDYANMSPIVKDDFAMRVETHNQVTDLMLRLNMDELN